MLNINPLQTEHLADVWQIEQAAHSHPWAKSMIDNLSSRGAMHYGLFREGQLLGYFYAQNIVGEVTILNIAIGPQWQGQGFGRQLLEHLIQLTGDNQADSIWLEVRESNRRAFNLYEDLGFNEVDRRRDYYPAKNGKEDAIIMSYLFF
ncbi:ribosomal-protein-alanine N-acetyltransferase [Vibrio albus]|uniref:[Ribosomal protein bS18]-alanine N-acetyltransferase n=1 Tax=Vibrio albus TaxID=2200953 RepID=A0A2U3BEM8_9VIBR|nr:ribosomal protein S18-alanine N-acetyltransferase [Vibrio albus]PWI35256.1 ribosomal-protein-alanine N-acetyltransferase [Vibrio albus]